MTEISSDNQLKLENFKEITQYETSDHAKILDLLEKCNWNLEIAIQRFFDNNYVFEPLPSEEPSISPAPRARTRTSQFDDSLVSQFDLLPKFPKANKIDGNWRNAIGIRSLNLEKVVQNGGLQSLWVVLLIVPRTIVLALLRLNEFLRMLFPGMYSIWEPDVNRFPLAPIIDDLDEKAEAPFDFKAHISTLTRDAVDLPIFNGEFNDAYDLAKAELKYLVLILVNDSKTSKTFLKHVVSSPEFGELINGKYADRDDNFIIWGGHVNTIEGYLVGKKYNLARLPYISLIANVSTYGETFPTMSLMKYSQTLNFELLTDDDSVEVKLKLKRIIKLLKKLANQYTIQLVDQKLIQDETNFERLMKQQQDDAYSRSLQTDKIKKEKVMEETKKKNNKKQKYLDKLKLDQVYLHTLKHYLTKWKSLLTVESTELEKHQICAIQFKLPDGERFVKKLSKENSLSDLYLFVQLKLLLKQFEEPDIEIINKVEEAGEPDEQILESFPFKFELNSNFPKFKVPSNGAKIADTLQLASNCSLLIEYDLDYQEQLDFLVKNFWHCQEIAISEVGESDIEDISSDEED